MLTLAILPAGKHGFKVSGERMPSRYKVHMSDKEGEHHEGTYRMNQSDGCQIKTLPKRRQLVVVEIKQA